MAQQKLAARQHPSVAASASVQSFDAVVVGAGFAGVYMLCRLRELRLSMRLFEAADRVGGTWDRRPRDRARQPGVLDWLRCADRRAVQDRPARPRRSAAAAEMGRRSAHLSGPDDAGLSEPVHHHRRRQSLGISQHGGRQGTSRRLDHKLHRLPARARATVHRSDSGRPRTPGRSTSARSAT